MLYASLIGSIRRGIGSEAVIELRTSASEGPIDAIVEYDVLLTGVGNKVDPDIIVDIRARHFRR
jgi:hypothetical protein